MVNQFFPDNKPRSGEPGNKPLLLSKGSPLPVSGLSKQAAEIVTEFDNYLVALSRTPSALHITRKQAEVFDKSLRRVNDKYRVTYFTYKGIEIKIYDARVTRGTER